MINLLGLDLSFWIRDTSENISALCFLQRVSSRKLECMSMEAVYLPWNIEVSGKEHAG